jgi:hypothetical protein
MLEEGDPSAKSHILKISSQFTNSSNKLTLEQLTSQINDYDFDLARKTLANLIQDRRYGKDG